MFGSIALDYTTKVRRPRTLYNGEAYDDRFSLLVMSGNVDPIFYTETLPDRDSNSRDARITAVQGNMIKTINNRPAIEFFENIGVVEDGAFTTAAYTTPLLINCHNSAKFNAISNLFFINLDGSVNCTSEVSVGGELWLGTLNSDDVVLSAKKIVDEAVGGSKKDLLIIFSCLSRAAVLSDVFDEINPITEKLNGSAIPYLFMYSMGEICPLYNKEGIPINRYHNYTIIACAL
jgi:hypothetical protein